MKDLDHIQAALEVIEKLDELSVILSQHPKLAGLIPNISEIQSELEYITDDCDEYY